MLNKKKMFFSTVASIINSLVTATLLLFYLCFICFCNIKWEGVVSSIIGFILGSIIAWVTFFINWHCKEQLNVKLYGVLSLVLIPICTFVSMFCFSNSVLQLYGVAELISISEGLIMVLLLPFIAVQFAVSYVLLMLKPKTKETRDGV